MGISMETIQKAKSLLSEIDHINVQIETMNCISESYLNRKQAVNLSYDTSDLVEKQGNKLSELIDLLKAQ